jgi:hypothetical protein
VTIAQRRGHARVSGVAPAAASAPGLMSEFGRDQLAAVTEASGAMFRGLEAMRAIQQRTAGETSARHQAAASAMRAATAPAELFTIQLALWQADIDAASRHWQALAGTALETQTELLACAGSRVFDTESALEAASAVEALDTLPGAALLLRLPAAARRSRRAHT